MVLLFRRSFAEAYVVANDFGAQSRVFAVIRASSRCRRVEARAKITADALASLR